MNCALWIRVQQKEQIFTTSPSLKAKFLWGVTSPYFNRKKKSLGGPNLYVAAHLNVPDEVVALLGRELVPEGEGALLAVVLEPLQ